LSSGSLFGGAFFGGGAPLLGGPSPGGPEGIPQGLAALAAGADGLFETLIVYVRNEAPGQAAQAMTQAHLSVVP
jgi:hypothetical protein